MMNAAKSLDPKLLRSLPSLLQQLQGAQEERRARRAELIERRRTEQVAFERNEQALLAEAAPIEARLTKVRAELRELESMLMPLANARMSAYCRHNESMRCIRRELKKDAFDEIQPFQTNLENLRSEMSSNYRCERAGTALKGFRTTLPMQARIAAALALTLDVYKRSDVVAFEAEDVTAGLRELSLELAAQGISIDP